MPYAGTRSHGEEKDIAHDEVDEGKRVARRVIGETPGKHVWTRSGRKPHEGEAASRLTILFAIGRPGCGGIPETKVKNAGA